MKANVFGITVGVVVIIALLIVAACMHSNNIQDVQVIQNLNGNVEIRGTAGWYFNIMPKIWTYKKTQQVAFSFVKQESKDNDGVHVIFSDRGQGDISTQVTYIIIPEREKILKMHELAQCGNDVIDQKILAKIRSLTKNDAGKITATDTVGKLEEFTERIRKGLVHNLEFQAIGIDITNFLITDIKYDELTMKAYRAAQEAELNKRTAEAEKAKFIQEKEKEVAKYEKDIATSKGQAEVEKIKAVTDAERQKELAEIKAKQEVTVAELMKKQANIEATRKLEIAEIQRKEEAARLEVIKIQSEQKIAAAKAKEQEIKLSGAITEAEKVKLEYEMNTKVNVAKAWAEGLARVKLPETMIVGGSSGTGGGSSIENLIQLMTIEKAQTLNKSVNQPIKK